MTHGKLLTVLKVVVGGGGGGGRGGGAPSAFCTVVIYWLTGCCYGNKVFEHCYSAFFQGNVWTEMHFLRIH